MEGGIPTQEFVDAYIDNWRKERDSDELLKDDAVTSEKLSSLFCIADLFNPEEDREEYEFDETRLRLEMKKILDGTSS